LSQSRAVVITEASSPIALATASRLARGGDLVLMGTRRTAICERLAARLRSGGAAAFAAYLDLDDPRSIDRFVESAAYLIGAADVLVSSAGLTDGSWVGAQHLAAQVIPPMIDNRRGDVVLISPELIGASSGAAHRMLEAWASGLEAEFVGTGVRASIIRSARLGARHMSPHDVGWLIAAAIGSRRRMHLRVIDVIPPIPATALAVTPRECD
jgi:NAD(P)-dependent dehydrogenase (short-subunit alcohol dehydrogenase family)